MRKRKAILSICLVVGFTLLTACNGGAKDNTATSIEKSNETKAIEKDTQEKPVKMYLETQHFKFYSTEEDKKDLSSLASFIEKNYARITKDLEYEPREKVPIYFWPDFEKLHEVLGVPDASNLLRGGFGGGAVHTVSPSLMWGVKIENVLLEEFSHLLINDLSSSVPKWLHEGLSGYEAGTRDESDVDFTVKNRVLGTSIPSFDELNTWDFASFESNNGYQLSDSIVQFLLNKYGMKKINKFMRSPLDYEGAFGISKDGLHKQWSKYLIEKYGT